MLSNKQKEYLANCNHRWNIKIGATGSGKTWLDYAVVIPKRIMAMKGEGAGVLLGNTLGTVNRNVIEPMRNIWGDALVGQIGGNNTVRLFGKKMYVLGADNKRNVARIQGMTIEYAYGDEMTTWVEGVFQMLKSRLRCNHSSFDGTANPDVPSHYIKEFLDSEADIYCQHTTIFDNPFLPKDFVDNLCKEYAGTVYYKRYILGEWALAEGLIYPMYEECVEEHQFDPENNEYSDVGVSVDYGTQNAFCAILWVKRDGIWHAVDEYYYSGRDTGLQKTDEEYSKDLDVFTESVRKYYGRVKVIIDPSASSFIALLKHAKHYKVVKADNNVLDGIRETATAMKSGRIKVNKSMKNWEQEVNGYVWDDKADEDRPVKENDHAMDAMRYFVRTMRVNKRTTDYKPLWNRY